jgi:hypothetical protein
MAGKKSPPKKNTDTPLTKADLKTEMVNYIGPIFVDLKDEFKTEIRSMGAKMLHEMKILLERDDRLNSLSDFGKTGEMNNEKIENLDERVTHLEKDVQVLKIAKGP